MAENIITTQCRNFKNYLSREFQVQDFGPFICGATFSLDKFLKTLEKVKTIATPVSFRIYYGCDADGTGHKLYISFLDESGRVIMTSNVASDLVGEDTLEDEYKCPPGDPCQNDVLINNL